MPIHLIRARATPTQLTEMLEELGIYIKLAVDIERQLLAGGGATHYDCEQVLLEEAVGNSMSGAVTGCRLVAALPMSPSLIFDLASTTRWRFLIRTFANKSI